MATIELPRSREREPRRAAGILLSLLAILAAIVLLATNPGILVALSSDKEGEALLNGSTLAPGATAQGAITLANEGILPLDYSVKVSAGKEELDSGVVLRLRRNGAANYLYQGPLTAGAIPIGRLLPGQHDRIEVVLWAPPSQSSSSIPIDDTFVWTGRSPGIDFWWWLIVGALILTVGAFAGPRILDLLARARRVPPLPYEVYWRVPLILAILLIAMLVPLNGVALTSVNAQTSNPANVFAIGTIALTDRSPSGTTCIAVPGRAGAAGSLNCDAIFQIKNLGPGGNGRASVTIRNIGTTPIADFLVWSGACLSGDAPAEPAHGTANLCPIVFMSIHDDSHNHCYWPVDAPGDCPLDASGTVAGFSDAHDQSHPVHLDPQGLGSGIVYSFALKLNPAADNTAQGRDLTSNYVWEIVST